MRSSSVSVRGDGATAVDCAAADHCRCSGAARGVGATLGGLELVLERGVGAALPLRGLRHERRGDGVAGAARVSKRSVVWCINKG